MFFEFGTIESIIDWGNVARPVRTAQHVLCQLGVHIEEGNEMLEAIPVKPPKELTALAKACKLASIEESGGYLAEINHKLMLDALLDQIVTALNTGNFLGYDMLGGLAEVDRSNWSKFEDGEPVFKPGTTKIGKGRYYEEPDLEPYLGYWAASAPMVIPPPYQPITIMIGDIP